ncbi:hypothetical protein [Actinokineospora pegani]|uniref:hypothetical protein n=1 Tax=Actinokineospora pegani TaxID=2654637 RepID=UPI0012EA5E54|nr:hypothetical protein [Actinokineospora pegani]
MRTFLRGVTPALLAGVLIATALVLFQAPAPVRVLAFAVLALAAGLSASRIVRGRAGLTDDDADVGYSLPGVVVLVLMLAVVLALSVLGIAIDTPGIAWATGASAFALVVVAHVVAGPPAWPTAPRRALGPVLAVVVLCAAVAGAAAMRPAQVERYTQLSVDETPPSVGGGERVSLGWTLLGYGSALPAAEPPVEVVIGGRRLPEVDAETGAVTATGVQGAVDQRRGTVAFTAPDGAGIYDVHVKVGAADWSEIVVRLVVNQ